MDKRAKPGAAIVPVLLCGGTGSRLWPLSREAYPKQFLNISGELSLFQQTAKRVEDAQFDPPIVVANSEHRFIVAEQLRGIGVSAGTLVIEPVGRNTAPAVAVAALHARERDPDATLLIMPTDHLIEGPAVLLAAMRAGVAAARAGRIALFGIEATKPAVGYGYIRRGPDVDGNIFVVAAFVEKPDRATAERYLAESYLWNSGIFMAGARVLLGEIERYQPAVVQAARAALAEGERDLEFLRLNASAFGNSPSISLDHAVMEHTDKAVVVPVHCGWTDLGTWSALWDVGDRDADGNVVEGDVAIEGVRDCYLRSAGPLVAAVGVEDLIVVATEDIVLVTRRGHDQDDVKRMVDRLKAEKRATAVTARRVYRPWGFYESIQHGHRYQVKLIVVNPGAKLSLQKHFHRAEHWVVVNGTALVTRDADELLVRENESVYLPLGCIHRLENPGKLPLKLVEVQSGAYLEEDDIVRIEDVYERA
jgi:mannose-1-phosphate guanylyltransferase / mannose-6-phosphate isomerase